MEAGIDKTGKEIENMECDKMMGHYSKLLVSEREICKVDGASVMAFGRKFCNKKLLPHNGSSVVVIELDDSIVIFTKTTGRYITQLYKDRTCVVTDECGHKNEKCDIPKRKRILTDEEKRNLSNEEIFMKEYGLYTSFCVSRYWCEVFKEIYGYNPSLLV